MNVIGGGCVLEQMRSYEVARNLFSFLEFVAWIVVVGGALLALVGFTQLRSEFQLNGTFGYAVIVIGVFASFMGLLGVAGVQMARATVDTAELTQQILKTTRDHLAVSRQAIAAHEMPKSVGRNPTTGSAAQQNLHAFQPQKTGQSGQTSGRVEPTLRPPEPMSGTTEYNGKQITAEKGKYLMNGIPFETLDAAKRYVDALAAPVEGKQLTASKTDV